jgi:hypothetical protein
VAAASKAVAAAAEVWLRQGKVVAAVAKVMAMATEVVAAAAKAVAAAAKVVACRDQGVVHGAKVVTVPGVQVDQGWWRQRGRHFVRHAKADKGSKLAKGDGPV